MTKKILSFFSVIILFFFISFAAIYVLGILTYKGGFTYGTWINGIYCTGKSVDEVNSELIENFKVNNISFLSDRFETESIELSSIDFSVDFKTGLTDLFNAQNNYLWFFNLSKSYIDKYMKPTVSFDENALRNEISSLSFLREYNESDIQEVKISYSDDGYFLVDNRHDVLFKDEIFNVTKDCIYSLESDVLLDDYFVSPLETDTIKKTLTLWNELDDYLTTRIVYDMGSELIYIDNRVLSSFLIPTGDNFKRNEDNSFYINEEAVKEFADNICDLYDTYGKERDFVTYKGEKKHIKKSIYGTRLDKKAEEEYLFDAIVNKVVERHRPIYEKEGYFHGLDDIGPEYIEVDLTNQKLYYIKDNLLNLEADIVTGKPSAGYATPELLCFVYKKAEKAILRGEGYASPVDYWMAIYGAIGLHDASWQSKFGGNRYLTHGSRGCINMKNEDASYLYDSINVGIPVIVYK